MAYLRRLILVGLGGCGALLVFALVGLVAGRIWIYKLYWLPQNGMYPSMPQGTLCLAWRQPYDSVAEVARGDVVVFEEEKDGRRYSVLWRVAGLPGDIVETGPEGVRVNGRLLSQFDEYRTRCLWFLRLDFYPETREAALRVLRHIERHGDREGFVRAGKLRRWLSLTSSERSAAS